MRQGSRDIVSGGVLLVASASLYLLIPGQIETLEGDSLTPASLPLAVSALIAALSAFLVIAGWRQRRHDLEDEPLSPKGSGPYLGATVATMVGYVALIPWAGYMASTAAALLALALLFGNRNWKHMLIMIVVAPPAILLFFRYTMLVLLPQGSLFE